MSDRASVIVQYVGGDERCREEVDMTSGRIRCRADTEASPVGGEGGALDQLRWAAQFAMQEDTSPWRPASKPRSVVVPLVSSVGSVGWRQRRQANEVWFCSWAPGAGPGTGQLPRNLVGFSSLQTLLGALDSVDGEDSPL